MKTKKRVKHPAVAVYINTSNVWKKEFYAEAHQLGLSYSAYGNLCIATGRKIIMSNMDKKKMPSGKKIST
jgi:predicted Rossmann-fold nucleotide-binding protein